MNDIDAYTAMLSSMFPDRAIADVEFDEPSQSLSWTDQTGTFQMTLDWQTKTDALTRYSGRSDSLSA